MLGRRMMLVVSMGIVVLVGGCGGSGDPAEETAAITPSEKTQNPYETPRCRRYCQPPAIEGPSAVFTSSSVFADATGQWSVSGPRRRTTVQAGAVAYRPSAGLLIVLRLDRSVGRDVGERVTIAGSGTLTLTKAPLDKRVMLSSQREGVIKFEGTSGITGTLHLTNDRVTLKCPNACPQVEYQH